MSPPSDRTLLPGSGGSSSMSPRRFRLGRLETVAMVGDRPPAASADIDLSHPSGSIGENELQAIVASARSVRDRDRPVATRRNRRVLEPIGPPASLTGGCRIEIVDRMAAAILDRNRRARQQGRWARGPGRGCGAKGETGDGETRKHRQMPRTPPAECHGLGTKVLAGVPDFRRFHPQAQYLPYIDRHILAISSVMPRSITELTSTSRRIEAESQVHEIAILNPADAIS